MSAPTFKLLRDPRYAAMEAQFRAAWQPALDPQPHSWAANEVRMTRGTQFTGDFDPDRSPWINVPMERMTDNAVSDVFLMAAAQSSKTFAVALWLAWAARNDPGETMWVSNSTDEVKKAAKDKVRPVLEGCYSIKEQLDRHSQTNTLLTLDLMTIQFASAKAWDQLFSKTIRYMPLDEVHTYKPGTLKTVEKRTRAVWNKRRVYMSRPNDWKDDVHRGFLSGDQNHYLVPCFHCGGLHEMKCAHIRVEENEETNPGGVEWDWPKAFETMRYICPLCGKSIIGTETERRTMARAGQWKSSNSKAATNISSFQWSAALPFWVDWKDIVKERLEAIAQMRLYYFEPFKVYIRETEGEPWEDRSRGEEAVLLKGPYNKGDKWPDAIHTFMAVDVQAKEQWVVVRAFAENSDSRLLWEGKTTTWEQVRQKQEEFAVVDGSVLVDVGGGGPRVDAAIQEAQKFGWTCLVGDSAWSWRHAVKRHGATVGNVHKPWRKETRDSRIGQYDEGSGLYDVWYWSNPSIYNALQGLLSQRSRIGGRVIQWLLPGDITEEYKWQLDSWHKILIHSQKLGRDVWQWQKRSANRPDHLRDCECMILVAAMMLGLLQNSGNAELPAESGQNAEKEAR